MRSKRSVHAVVRGPYRLHGFSRGPEVRTLCEDGMLWQLTRDNSQKALHYRRPIRPLALLRKAGRRVLAALGLL